MTDISPGQNFHQNFEQTLEDDIRPADIAMALGGLWVLLATILYLTVSTLITTPMPDRMTLSMSDLSRQAVDTSHGTQAD